MSTWKTGKKWFYRFQWKGQSVSSEKGYDTQEEARLEQAKKKVVLSKTKTIHLDFVTLCENRLKDLQSRRANYYLLDNKQMVTALIEDEGWALKKEITPLDVTTYLDRVSHTVSPQRANKYLAYIKALFNYGMRLRLISDNPANYISRYPEDRKQKRVPSKDEVLAVMKVCTPEQQDYLWALALTAARCGEINSLRLSDVDLERNILTLGTRKAKDGHISYRNIRMGVMLKEIIARRSQEAKKEGIIFVFFNSRTGEPFNYRSKFLRNKCEKAKVQVFTYHSLRHFASVIMDRAGVPLTDIQNVLGHQRATTTDIYLSSVRAAEPSATEILENEIAGSQEKVARGKQANEKP